ncbi:YwmB family TATA-box binding protein [Brevibacillus parabrevis]
MGIKYKGNVKKLFIIIFGLVFLFGMFVAVKTVHGVEEGEVKDARFLYQLFTGSQVKVEKMALQHSNFLKGNQSVANVLSMKTKLEKTFSLSLQEITDAQQRERLIKFQGQKQLSDGQMLRLVWGGERERVTSNEILYKTFIVVEMIGQVKEEQQLEINFKQLFELLRSAGIQPVINVSLKGVYPAKMNISTQKSFIRSLLNKFNGTVVEGFWGETSSSLTGYSGKLSRFVSSKGEKVNIQMNTHLSSNGEETIVFIGFPIIIID